MHEVQITALTVWIVLLVVRCWGGEGERGRGGGGWLRSLGILALSMQAVNMYGRTPLGPWSAPVVIEQEKPTAAPEPKVEVCLKMILRKLNNDGLFGDLFT